MEVLHASTSTDSTSSRRDSSPQSIPHGSPHAFVIVNGEKASRYTISQWGPSFDIHRQTATRADPCFQKRYGAFSESLIPVRTQPDAIAEHLADLPGQGRIVQLDGTLKLLSCTEIARLKIRVSSFSEFMALDTGALLNSGTVETDGIAVESTGIPKPDALQLATFFSRTLVSSSFAFSP